MELKKVVDEFENALPLEEVKISSGKTTFQLYPWLKSRIFHEIITGRDTMQAKTGGFLLLQIKSLLYGWWNFFRKYDVWVFSNSMERRLINQRYFDKLFDYLGNESGLKTWIIEFQVFQTYPYKKIASKYASSKALFLLLEELYAFLFLRKIKIQREDLLIEMQNKLGTTVNHKQVARKYLAQYALMKTLLKVLPNPKLVCLSVAYINFGYIRAFKEKGIKVVEFQHGSISKEHYSYYYRKAFDPIQFPDAINCYGAFEKEVFDSENLFPLKSLYPVGSFVLDYYQGTKLNKQGQGVAAVAVTLQDDEFGDVLLMFISGIAQRLKNVDFFVKRRRTSLDYYQSKFEFPSNVFFEETDNIYQLLTKCDVHCTIYSSAATESLSLGTSNFLYNYKGYAKAQLNQLLENKYCHFVEDSEEFIELLSSFKVPNKEEVIWSNATNMQPNYKANIKSFLKEMEMV